MRWIVLPALFAIAGILVGAFLAIALWAIFLAGGGPHTTVTIVPDNVPRIGGIIGGFVGFFTGLGAADA